MNEQVNESVDQVEDQQTQTIQDQFFGIKNDVVADVPEVELEGMEETSEVVQEQQQESVGSEIEEIKKQLEAEQNAKKAALSAETEAIRS